MVKRSIAFLVVVFSVAGLHTVVSACGDKFLLPSRGTRFQQAPGPRRPASVLVYANPAAALSATLSRLSVEAHLRQVGYRPTVVATEDALAAALSLGGWDVVLTDASDIATIQDRLVATGTHLLPVLSTGEPANAPQLRRFARIIKAPKKADAFVEAIDRTLVLEAGAARPAGFRH